jgi:hypothetical protein
MDELHKIIDSFRSGLSQPHSVLDDAMVWHALQRELRALIARCEAAVRDRCADIVEQQLLACRHNLPDYLPETMSEKDLHEALEAIHALPMPNDKERKP